MYASLLLLLLPLIVGYLLPLSSPVWLHRVSLLLNGMIYLILFLMGVSLAFLDDLSRNLLTISRITLTCSLVILFCNALALVLYSRLAPWPQPATQVAATSRLGMVLESLKMCGGVLLGFLVGLTRAEGLQMLAKHSDYVLLALLFLVGIQLRSSGISLRQILLNKRGIYIALIVALSSLAGGLIVARLLALPVNQSLAIASGFGWYSLSGILITNAFGPVVGTAAFFSDLIRELSAIAFLPLLIHQNRAVALGLCGATSMDFTLPILQRNGGADIVPAAIVHGFLLSLCAPLLITLFTSC